MLDGGLVFTLILSAGAIAFAALAMKARAQRRPKQYRLSALIWSRKRKAAQAFGPGGSA